MTDRFAAFRYSSYARYFISRFFTSFSVQVLSVAVGWQIYDATRDPALDYRLPAASGAIQETG